MGKKSKWWKRAKKKADKKEAEDNKIYLEQMGNLVLGTRKPPSPFRDFWLHHTQPTIDMISRIRPPFHIESDQLSEEERLDIEQTINRPENLERIRRLTEEEWYERYVNPPELRGPSQENQESRPSQADLDGFMENAMNNIQAIVQRRWAGMSLEELEEEILAQISERSGIPREILTGTVSSGPLRGINKYWLRDWLNPLNAKCLSCKHLYFFDNEDKDPPGIGYSCEKYWDNVWHETRGFDLYTRKTLKPNCKDYECSEDAMDHCRQELIEAMVRNDRRRENNHG